jgi:hypothetical protein
MNSGHGSGEPSRSPTHRVPRVFPEATAVLELLLDGLDASAPGLITGCHIVGSIALGDGRPGQSDLDLVLVRNATADNATTMAVLKPVLAELRRERPMPSLDGMVLTDADLAAGPDAITGDRPIIFENEARLGTDASGRNPVTWQTLRQCGIAWRGRLDRDALWHDPARLDGWTRGNLERYWRPWLAKSNRLASRSGVVSLGEWATEWGVLGVTRLHYTLATGDITSKHGAGLYALETFPERWHPIIEEALRIRERRDGHARYRNLFRRRHEMRNYVAMVIDDALALPTRR